MAKRGRRKDDPAAAGSESYLIPALLAILIGAAGGLGFGYFGDIAKPLAASKDVAAESTEPPTQPIGRFPRDALEIQVPSIIVQLKGEPKTSARLDLSVIAAHGTPETSTLKSEIREDVIAYLEGLTAADIEGVRGFQNLRQQLDDRAKIRGRGSVLGILIGGLILE
jgi:flagellar FliL protein